MALPMDEESAITRIPESHRPIVGLFLSLLRDLREQIYRHLTAQSARIDGAYQLAESQLAGERRLCEAVTEVESRVTDLEQGAFARQQPVLWWPQGVPLPQAELEALQRAASCVIRIELH